MTRNHPILTPDNLDTDSRELLEIAFKAYLDKTLEKPTESDYLIVILGLFDNIMRRVEADLPGRPGRPKKGVRDKEELFLAMSSKRLVEGLKSDKAAQALFRENDFGRSNWKALKGAYHRYRKELLDYYGIDEESLPADERDRDLRLKIFAARGRGGMPYFNK